MSTKILNRKNYLRTTSIVYLVILLIGVILSFLASYYVVNGDSGIIFKVFMLPIVVLYIVINFLLLLFVIELSNEKFEEVPKWWVLFYISIFIPYIKYFIPLCLFIIFLSKGISLKKLIIVGILNFLPLIFNKPITNFIYKILSDYIFDKTLLLDLNIFLKELIYWICINILVYLITSLSYDKDVINNEKIT